MGSDHSSLKNQIDLDIAKEYTQIRKVQNGTVLQHNSTNATYLLKQMTYGSQMQFEKDKQRFEAQTQTCDNILNVIKIKTQIINGLCSTTYKIYVVYQYPQVTLRDQIQARQKEENRFDEHQLWSILQSCNYALSVLRPTLSLNPHQIFITPDGQIKTINNDMIDENYRFSVNSKFYYAPQKITNFNKLDTEAGLIKQAVFSMGMTLLQAAILDEVTDCYDYSQQLFLQQNLSCMLQSLRQVYSQDFIEILRSTLEIDVNIRSSFTDIQKMLDNYWNNQNAEQSTKRKPPADGESLNIQQGQQPANFLSSHQGIFRNLVTVASNEKESLKQEYSIVTSINNKPNFNKNRANDSLKYSKQVQSTTLQANTGVSKQEFNSTNSKQNLYTDPKLLAMIKKDLADISKLKLSALKQTTKCSIIPQSTESIFSSIKDARLSSKTPNQSTNKATNHLLSDMQLNNSIGESLNTKDWKEDRQLRQSMGTETNIQEKFSKLQISKESFIQRQNQMQMRKLMNSNKQKATFSRFRDQEGRWYQGYIVNGKKQGKGKLMFEDGAYYEGQFKSGQMDGKGVLYYNTNQPAYDGMWFKDQFHGHGILYNEYPVILKRPFNYREFQQVDEYWIKYEGQFRQDYKCGLGALYLTNGEIIEAIFEQDCVNGEGRFTKITGQQITGLWSMNRLLEIRQL